MRITVGSQDDRFIENCRYQGQSNKFRNLHNTKNYGGIIL